MARRSGAWRRAILDGGQTGRFDGRRQKSARRGQARNAKGQSVVGRRRRNRHREEDGVRPGGNLVAAKTGVDLGWVLGRQQVVGHGDCRQKDKQQHRQGNQLRAAVRGSAPIKSQPQADQRDGQQRPGEIEGLLHSLCRFYNRGPKGKKAIYSI